jgi:hypothetical protein
LMRSTWKSWGRFVTAFGFSLTSPPVPFPGRATFSL